MGVCNTGAQGRDTRVKALIKIPDCSMPNLLKPLVPLTQNATTFAYRQEIMLLCRNLLKPGFSIPPETDLKLAEALLTRELGRTELVLAALNVLRSNSWIQEILECAWTLDEQSLNALLADGTLVAFLNTPLMRALLMTSPIPDLSFERLFTHVRNRLLICALDPGWSANATVLDAAVALSLNAYLTDYIFNETPHEKELVRTLCRNLETQSGPFDPFDVTVVASYQPLHTLDFVSKIEKRQLFESDPSMQMLWRTHVLDVQREHEIANSVSQATPIENETSHLVRAFYEESPYPRWISYIRNDPTPPVDVLKQACTNVNLDVVNKDAPFKVLVAGCGTGVSAIENAVLWADTHVYAVDLSKASLAFAQRCAEELKLSNVEFDQADLLQLPASGRMFDYISCTGVLYHLSHPEDGLKALLDVCRPGGVIRVGLYSKMARSEIKTAAGIMKSFGDGETVESIRVSRQALIDSSEQGGKLDENLMTVFSNFDFYNSSMCRDLIFHVHEIEFTIPMIQDMIDSLGVHFCGFVDSEGTILSKYKEFTEDDPLGVDLNSWDRFESAHPNTFGRMYDFMVQKPLN